MENRKRPCSVTSNCNEFKRKRTRFENEVVDNSAQPVPQSCEPVLDLSSMKKYLLTALSEIENFKNCILSLSREEEESQNNNDTVTDEQTPNAPQSTENNSDNNSVPTEKTETTNVDNCRYIKQESENINTLAEETIEASNCKSESVNKKTSDSGDVQAAEIVREDRIANENKTVEIRLKESLTFENDKLKNYEDNKQLLSNAWQESLANSSETDSSDSESMNPNVIDISSHFRPKNSNHSYNGDETFNGGSLLPKVHLVFGPSASVLNVMECLKNAGIEGVEDVVLMKNACYNNVIVTFEDKDNLYKTLALDQQLSFNNAPVRIKLFRDPMNHNGKMSTEKSPIGKVSPKFNKKSWFEKKKQGSPNKKADTTNKVNKKFQNKHKNKTNKFDKYDASDNHDETRRKDNKCKETTKNKSKKNMKKNAKN